MYALIIQVYHRIEAPFSALYTDSLCYRVSVMSYRLQDKSDSN